MLAVNFPTCLEQPINSSATADDEQLSPDFHTLDCEIAGVLSSISRLLVKYNMYNKNAQNPPVSGGLQQFMINKLKRRGENEKSISQRLKALYNQHSALIPTKFVRRLLQRLILHP